MKKNREEIKQAIILALEQKPLSTQQISEKIMSNWSTVNEVLGELKAEGKVREIVTTDKIKIYHKLTGDTYFDMPISSDERKKFRTLFSLIIKKYKELNETPNKTQLAKVAVKVINSQESGLSELPTVWYLYGMIPLMIADPSQDYQEEFVFEDKQKIMNIIAVFITENKNKKTKQIQKEQHKEYNDRLYQLHDDFLELIEKNSWNNDKIFELLNEFFIVCPINEEFKEVFMLTDRFISTVRKLAHFDKLENHRTKILLTFDALWKFIATYKFYETISFKRKFSDKNLLNLYLGNTISVRKSCAEESLSDLYSVYLSKLDDRKLELPPEAEKVREIMQGWTGED